MPRPPLAEKSLGNIHGHSWPLVNPIVPASGCNCVWLQLRPAAISGDFPESVQN